MVVWADTYDFIVIISRKFSHLTHWGRVEHLCVGKLIIIGSDNGLSPEWRQAIIWINAGILLIGPLGTSWSETLIEIQTFSLKKIRLKMSSAKSCSYRLGLNGLNYFTNQWSTSHMYLTLDSSNSLVLNRQQVITSPNDAILIVGICWKIVLYYSTQLDGYWIRAIIPFILGISL